MAKTDTYERKILRSFASGKLKSVATKSELEKLKTAAKATAIKERGVTAGAELAKLKPKERGIADAVAWARRLPKKK